MFYAPGLIGQSLRMCFENLFYSYQETKTPMYTGILTVVLNVIFNLILIKPLGHKGLALATSISMLMTSLVMYIIIRKKVKFNEVGTLVTGAKIILSGLAMGVFTKQMWKFMAPFQTGKIKSLLLLIFTILVSMLVYLVITMALGVKDTRSLFSSVKAKLGRKNA